MKSILFSLVITMTFAAKKCNQKHSNAIPPCIQERIDQLSKAPVRNPPAEVRAYDYHGQRVYYFNAPCCDPYDSVYDAQCRFICAPGGGFTGKGDGKCPDFDQAKEVRVVWKDERKRVEGGG